MQDRIIERLKQLAGPLIDLPPREEAVRKFSNHCRLWVGNLPLDIKEDDVRELFKPFGEYDEVYFDKNKGFAFVRMVSVWEEFLFYSDTVFERYVDTTSEQYLCRLKSLLI